MTQQKKKKVLNSQPRSQMGKLLPPIDIQDESQLDELDKRISLGPVLVFIYADWCGHCQRYKPNMDELEATPGRSVQIARVRDDVYPKSSLKNTPPEGYPTLMLIKENGEVAKFEKEGKVSPAIPNHTDMNQMKLLVRNAGKKEVTTLLNKNKINNTVLTMKPLSNMTIPSSQKEIEEVDVDAEVDAEVDADVDADVDAKEMVEETLKQTNTKPNTILSDRLSSNHIEQLNTKLKNSSNVLENVTADVPKKQEGGGLWYHLMMASNKMAPAAALLLGASALNNYGKSKAKTQKRSYKSKKRKTVKTKKSTQSRKNKK
jgi:thiol-disulfide isomerase/thioredoxin